MKIHGIAYGSLFMLGVWVFLSSLVAAAPSTDLTSLLNMANQMNNEEQADAKELRSKVGDNQALITMADTLQQDHKANQTALEALAKQKNITLDSYSPNKDQQDRLDDLNGAAFNREFFKTDIADHKKALATFKSAKGNMTEDRDVVVYIDQTIPVLEAHLKMAENLQHDTNVLGSNENPANNKSQ